MKLVKRDSEFKTLIKLSGENRYPTNERNGNIENQNCEENILLRPLDNCSGRVFFYTLKTQMEEHHARYQTHSGENFWRSGYSRETVEADCATVEDYVT